MAFPAHGDYIPHALIAQSLVMQVMGLIRSAMQVFMADNAPPAIKLESCLPYLLPVRMTPDIFAVVDQ
jgi:hypothetical protein